jgi:N,N'-diacetyllegionaminate synthase
VTRTLVIAECGSSWDCDIQKAFRLIEAAKECGADVAKFQWTSNAKAMAERRLGANAARSIEMYKRYLEYPLDVLVRLKAHCDSVGIEFMVTVYLIEDIATIAPLVKRFKVSAFECEWAEFIYAHKGYGKQIIASKNPGKRLPDNTYHVDALHCISEYPTPMEHLGLRNGMQESNCVDGLSDHTTSTLTGALAVAAGATIIEKHIRLRATSPECPDYGHSLVADCMFCEGSECFGWYVANIREAERAL